MLADQQSKRCRPAAGEATARYDGVLTTSLLLRNVPPRHQNNICPVDVDTLFGTGRGRDWANLRRSGMTKNGLTPTITTWCRSLKSTVQQPTGRSRMADKGRWLTTLSLCCSAWLPPVAVESGAEQFDQP